MRYLLRKTATLSSPDMYVVQYDSAVQYSTVQYNTVQYSTLTDLFHERVRSATNTSAFEVSRTRSLKHQTRQCIANYGASELWRFWYRGQATKSVCNASVSEARLGRNTTTVTNGSLSRAPISGVTNRPVEKGPNSHMFQEKVTRT